MLIRLKTNIRRQTYVSTSFGLSSARLYDTNLRSCQVMSKSAYRPMCDGSFMDVFVNEADDIDSSGTFFDTIVSVPNVISE